MIVAAWGKTYAQNEGPEDITSTYLKNADLLTIQEQTAAVGQGWQHGGFTDWKTNGAVAVVEFWNWSNQFSFTQTVTLPAGDYRLAVNAFYRNSWDGDGTNNDMAWIFANDTKQNVVALKKGELNDYAGSNDLYKAATAFSQGKFSNEFDFSLETETEVTLGFRGTTPNGGWCILGPVKLYQYSLEDYLVAYREKVAEAQALYSEPMNAQVLQALQDAVVSESSFSLGSQVQAAISTLNEKITAANTSINNYKEALDVLNAASTLTAAGKNYYAASEIIQEIQSAYDAKTLVSLTAEQKAAAKQALTAAVLQQTEVGADFTAAAPADWVGRTGMYQNTRPERFGTTVYTGDVMTQTINGLEPGAYKVILEATASTTNSRDNIQGAQTGDNLSVVFANNTNVNLPVVSRLGIDNVSEYGPYEVIGKVGSDGVLTYGIKNIDNGGNWFVVNLISITKIEYVPVESITASDIEVEKSRTVEIGATIAPSTATFPTITYVSDDETIATVDAEGVVTGVAVGSTTITITADGVTKIINVTVVAPAVLPESITLEPSEIALNFTGTNTAQIISTITPAEANQEVSFVSSDESVATVDAEGNVTAVGIGTATITVTSKANEEVYATVAVTVTGPAAPSKYTTEIVAGTDYWLYNAVTGKYLGGANSWGTRASLIEHGTPFKFVQAAEGVYNLDSYTSNGGNSHFLAITDNGPFIDQPAAGIIISPNTNGSFCLKIGDNYLKAKTANTEVDLNGTSANDPFAQWYLISQADWMAMLQNASASNPVDATFFIKDFNFSRNNQMYQEWTWTFADPGNTNHNNAGDNTNFCVESYHAAFNQAQEIVVPNGTYKLTAQGFYRNDGGTTPPVFFANDQEESFPEKTGSDNSMTDASISFSKGLYKINPITVTVTDRILKIGAKCEDTDFWCIWDNFELEAVSISEQQGVPVDITTAGYATLYYGKLDLAVPTGLKAYTATVDNKKVTLTDIGSVIPAGTGVVLEADDNLTTTTTFYFSLGEAPSAAIEKGDLQGTDEATTINATGYKYYVLSLAQGGDASTIGFYYDKDATEENGGSFVNNGAHKAYLAVPEPVAGGTTAYLFDTTGIHNVNAIMVNTGEAYTISGVRVKSDNLQKGLYIIDGKKIIIK